MTPLNYRALLRRWLGRYLEGPLVALLARGGVGPNALTLMGLALTGGVAYLASTGRFFPAGLLLLATGALDMLDGALARATGKASPLGAALDSVADRLGEMGLFLGLLLFYLRSGEQTPVVLAFLAFAASVMVSYSRARAEALGLRGDVGLMARPERILVMALGLLLGWVAVAMGLVAGLAALTALHRLLHIWRTAPRR